MIGIDLTKITRFTKDLSRYNKVFGTEFTSKKDLAKFWACYEALIKASGIQFKPHEISIIFKSNSPPVIIDNNRLLDGEYCLTLSHEDDLVVAVAMLKRTYND